MQKSWFLGLFIVFCVGECCSQSIGDPQSQGTTSQGVADCSDPSMADSAACGAAQAQGSRSAPGRDYSSPSVLNPVLRTPGFNTDQYYVSPAPLNPSQLPHPKTPIRPETEFEQMVADSVGRALPLFGQSLFVQPPSTFSPIDRFQIPSDYTIGPGDELQIRVWGQVEADLRVIVDRSGQIYIPQVGGISVAGLHYRDLEEHLQRTGGVLELQYHGHWHVSAAGEVWCLLGSALSTEPHDVSCASGSMIFGSPGLGSLRHIQVRGRRYHYSFEISDLLSSGRQIKDCISRGYDDTLFRTLVPWLRSRGP
jgi:hypothetical protein